MRVSSKRRQSLKMQGAGQSFSAGVLGIRNVIQLESPPVSASAATTAAAIHIAITKQTAGRIEPLRLRKLSGFAETIAEKIPAQPTITATLPNRGRTKNTASTQASEK
jgi:hypothetical protein